MADNKQVKFVVDKQLGTITIRVNETPVVLGIIMDGPLRLTMDPQGNVGPAIPAEHYVILKDGRPIGVMSKDEIAQGIATAFGKGEVVCQTSTIARGSP